MLSPIQLYRGRTYDLKGFTARTVHIPIELDDALKMMAIKNHVRFSDMAIIAFKEHVSRRKN